MAAAPEAVARAATPPLQGRDALLKNVLGGVGQAAIDVAGVCQAEAVSSMLAVAEDIGSGLVNGHRAGIGSGIGLLLANMQLKGSQIYS